MVIRTNNKYKTLEDLFVASNKKARLNWEGDNHLFNPFNKGK